MSDPRQVNGHQRRKAARRYAAMNAPCSLCGGRRGPIDYAAPRNHNYPLSLVIDEVCPVARWMEGGYSSAVECASDPANWQPAHWVCNALAGDKRRPRKQLEKRLGKGDSNSGTF